MSSIVDLTKSKKLMDWVGKDEEDLLIAYSHDLRDNLTALMAARNSLQGTATTEEAAAIDKAASLMARLSVDMKTIHREIFK